MHARPIAARKAFSLLELTLVLAIIGMLMAVAAWNFLGEGERAKEDTTRITLRTISEQLSAYQLRHSVYPADLQTLKTANYMKPDFTFVDSWNRALMYDPRPQGEDRPFVLFSMGKDGVQSADDISVWDKK